MLEAISLDQKLDREFGSQETEELHRGSVVVVVLVHSQVIEKLVGQGVRDVAYRPSSQYSLLEIILNCILWSRTSIQLKTKEHKTKPCQQPQVSLADDSSFFFWCPCRLRVPSVSTLVRLVRLKRDMCAADLMGVVFREAVGCNKLRLRDRVLDWRTHRG